MPSISESGREKYTYSIVQIARSSGYAKRSARRPSFVMIKNSPGSTERTNSAPTISKAQVSDAVTQASPSLPRDKGRSPFGSKAIYIASSVKITQAKAPFNKDKAFFAFSSNVA